MLQGGCTESPTKPKGRPRKDAFNTSATCTADTTCHEPESHIQDGDSLSSDSIHVDDVSFDTGDDSLTTSDSRNSTMRVGSYDVNKDVTNTHNVYPE